MLDSFTMDMEPRNGEQTPAPGFSALPTGATLADAIQVMGRIMQVCRSRIFGRDEVIKFVITGLFADGHVILEDHPGSGKTTLAKTLGQIICREGLPHADFAAFRRVQFTPDLMPSDVTGVTIFEPETRAFVFRHGPLFSNIVLADEINRTSPKVQAALLEAMAEKQVTVDNHTYPLEDLFFVIATQNPHDTAGTFPLPRAQLDRFLFKLRMTYLTRETELEVVRNWRQARTVPTSVSIAPQTIIAMRQVIGDSVFVSPIIQEALCDIAQQTRQDRRVALGISTRSLVLGVPALQVWAALHGRDFVTCQDVVDLSIPLFSHRVELAPGFKDADIVVRECVAPAMEIASRKTLKT